MFTVWILTYSLTRYGPSILEIYPTEDACMDAGFEWLEGADRWKNRSEIETGGPKWFCAELNIEV